MCYVDDNALLTASAEGLQRFLFRFKKQQKYTTDTKSPSEVGDQWEDKRRSDEI